MGLADLDVEVQDAERLVLAEFLPFQVALSAKAVSDLMSGICEGRLGLSIPAWRILCLLAENPVLEPRDLAFRAALSDSQADEAVGILMLRGFAGREADGVRLSITDEGLAVHAELSGLALAAQAALVSGLSPAEVYVLNRLLSRVRAAALRLSGRPRD